MANKHMNACMQMFTAALFIINRKWKQPKHPSAHKWINQICCVYTVEYYTSLRKEQFTNSCCNMCEPQKHYA